MSLPHSRDVLILEKNGGLSNELKKTLPVFNVQWVSTKTTFLQKLKEMAKKGIGALVLDWKLLEHDKADNLLTQLLTTFPTIPIVILGKEDNMLTIMKGNEEGVVYVTPFTEKDFKKCIIKSIAHSETESEYKPIEKELNKIKTEIKTEKEKCQEQIKAECKRESRGLLELGF